MRLASRSDHNDAGNSDRGRHPGRCLRGPRLYAGEFLRHDGPGCCRRASRFTERNHILETFGHIDPPPAVGTFTGPVAETRYGPVQVAITVAGGKIVDASAVTAPSADAKSADISQQAIPQLREATLAAQSAEVAAVSGATFTSTGWRTSLQAALAQAGL